MSRKYTLTKKAMYAYGYKWAGMMPLTTEEALSRYDNDMCVYRLYSDNTESAVEERSEIEEHDGIFGFEIPWYAANK